MSQQSASLATSAFEILGPIMVGPSSSHTAGALRLAQVASSLLEGTITSVRFTLWNSFAQTYQGHGTDRALVAGMLGLQTDDEQIRDAFTLAKKRSMNFEFVVAGENTSLHPNTVDIEMTNTQGLHATVRGESLGGGKIRISRINEVEVNISGAYCTLFVAHRDAPGALAALTTLLAEERVNIAFCSTYRTEAGGQAYSVFETDEYYSGSSFIEKVKSLDLVDYATFIEVPGSAAPSSSHSASNPYLFSSAQELLSLCEAQSVNIGKIMTERECYLYGKEATTHTIRKVIQVMKEETSDPLLNPKPSLGGFIGGEAQKINKNTFSLADSLMGTVQTNAVARAMAVLERSAAMGVIVAAPTAGSAGVVPGCLLAEAEYLGLDFNENDGCLSKASSYEDSSRTELSNKQSFQEARLQEESSQKECPQEEPSECLQDALFCAAAIGYLLSTNACVAGAEGGCQAEVGSAAAMAAGALVQMLGGTPKQCLDAASLCLSNLLGLVCDPVGGLVEVPCQNRNAIGVSAAFSSAQLALSGITSLVPFDEMARVMLEVGHALPATLRETALGGIATAPSALHACHHCNTCK